MQKGVSPQNNPKRAKAAPTLLCSCAPILIFVFHRYYYAMIIMVSTAAGRPRKKPKEAMLWPDEEETKTCRKCGEQFETLPRLRSHKASVHGE